MRFSLITALALLGVATPHLARADIVPSFVTVCEGKKAGARCLRGGLEGRCTPSTCMGKYGDPDYPCLICERGKKAGPNPSTSPGITSKAATAAAPQAATSPAATPPAATPSAAASSNGAPPAASPSPAAPSRATPSAAQPSPETPPTSPSGCHAGGNVLWWAIVFVALLYRRRSSVRCQSSATSR